METDYECYLLGCQSAGVEPLGLWHFRLLQQAYLRQATAMEQEPERIPVPPLVLERLAELIAEGYKIAASSSHDDEPGAATCGVREPRVPLEPLLTASAARSLPTPDAPDRSFWRV